MRDEGVALLGGLFGSAQNDRTWLAPRGQLQVDQRRVAQHEPERVAAAGRMALAFPERRDGHGRMHPVVRPLSAEARRAIEAEVFRQATEVKP